ncbi:unnamed protein product [Owenia fusiformis]|uniref:Zinc metalloproteinase n=1 Tax=Owenia fusiformis TaxID=6347 RepID=A0A8S4Q6W0_OWEFU|nr:unnamed protein product [Owenia fusiformis]
MDIKVTNLEHGDVLTYSLALIKGDVKQPCRAAVVCVYTVENKRKITWPIVEGLFKAFVELRPGLNHVLLEYADSTLTLDLTYKQIKFNKFVLPIYIICSDDEGHFQADEDQPNDISIAKRKIILNAKLLQTFTAEKLKEQGFGRKTFQLVTDSTGKVACHTFTTKLKLAEVHSMTAYDLWVYFAKEIICSGFPNKENYKWFAFMSFTRYTPPSSGIIPTSHSEIIKCTKAYAALGGGGLALFGTATMHTWAHKLEHLTKCFTNNKKIDKTKLMDDSAYRGYYWANYSTGLGSSLHELGHTFDLAHNPSGIMARGFDDLYRVFIVPTSTPHLTPCSSPRRITPCSSPVRQRLEVKLTTKPPPLIVQVQTGFLRLSTEQRETMTIREYDGSEVRKTVSKELSGGEMVTETKVFPCGHVSTSQIRRTSIGQSKSVSSSPSSSRASSPSPRPAMLPKTPPEGTVCMTSKIDPSHEDGGAHWYRSSAVVLAYHKWLNPPHPDDPDKVPTFQGDMLHSSSGLRVIELRTVPDGMVFHHWEFLSGIPPITFKLKAVEIAGLSSQHSLKEFTVLAEDSFGNLLKKKVSLTEIANASFS